MFIVILKLIMFKYSFLLYNNMEIRNIKLKELKKADDFQQSILNPNKRKRYRPWSTIYNNYKRESSLFVGAFDKNKIKGIVFGYIKKNKILLGEMAVSNKYQGKNIGKKLINKFETNAKKLNKNYIELGAWGSAEKFYLKLNYYPILFLQTFHNKIPKNYKKLKYNIIKETNYLDAKRLFIKVDKLSKKLKQKAEKDFKAYNAIYLFRKEL
jgi:GNAT superfamily N-acetyltransferase